MRQLILLFFLLIISQLCFSQKEIDAEVSQHIIFLNKIVLLSEDQRSSILEIYKDYVKEKSEISKGDYKNVADFLSMQMKLYSEVQKKVYDKLTFEQMAAYVKYRKERLEKQIQRSDEEMQKIIQSHKN